MKGIGGIKGNKGAGTTGELGEETGLRWRKGLNL